MWEDVALWGGAEIQQKNVCMLLLLGGTIITARGMVGTNLMRERVCVFKKATTRTDICRIQWLEFHCILIDKKILHIITIIT